MVIDAESGNTIADIPGQKIAHGVAVVPAVGRGFISDGGGNGAIIIFDLKTNAVLGSIVAQADADGVIYDPATDRVPCSLLPAAAAWRSRCPPRGMGPSGSRCSELYDRG